MNLEGWRKKSSCLFLVLLLKSVRLCIARAFQHCFQYIHLHARSMIYIHISRKIEWYFAFVKPVVIRENFLVMVNPLIASFLQENCSNADFLFHLTFLGTIFLSPYYPHFQQTWPRYPFLLDVHLQLLWEAFSGRAGRLTKGRVLSHSISFKALPWIYNLWFLHLWFSPLHFSSSSNIWQ